jgi:aldose 1-epimerase
MRVRLKRDSLEADIAPGIGGAIAAFRHDGRDMFVAADPRGVAEFPMGPYVNRIADGRFRWRNEAVTLPRNFGDHPHPLHGIGWQRAWSCDVLSASAAQLRLAHEADASWPWRVKMTRGIALMESGLEVVTSLTNDDARPMPASIGLHPFLPAAGAVLKLNATAQVLTTEDGIPVRVERTPVVDALATGVNVEVLALDHCFSGWDGRAEIVWPTHTLRIETEPAQRYVQVFTPKGAGFFCVEPQSAAPDAVNRAGYGAIELAPGETLAFTVRYTVHAPT